MAEIKSLQKQRKFPDIRFIPYILIALLFAFSLHSQDPPENIRNKKKVELIYADEDIVLRDEITKTDIHHIIGNVKFRMNESTLTCDSAHWFPDKVQISAFSRAHLEQGDTLNLYSNFMFYDGKTDIAVAKGEVELIDKETHLYTDAINYDVTKQVAKYDSKGREIEASEYFSSKLLKKLHHFKKIALLYQTLN